MTKVHVVVYSIQGGKPEVLGAYFNEQTARWEASKMVNDKGWVTIQTIDVLDEPVHA